MKNLILLLFLCSFCSLPSIAQSQEASVISAAGSSMKAADIQIDWSIGEVAIEAYENPKARQALLEGFHRSYLSTVKSDKIATPLDGIQVYPNPFQKAITIALPAPNANIQLEVFAMDGRNLVSRKMSLDDKLLKINLSNLSVGSYLLSFLNLSTGERTSQIIQKSE
ncbi:T9SS type A sorting domain-containing protein [Pontibacter sp. 172403-2]|uniref:T9SS type A sorting domain-containing protein n=1 Tax=Pontibacter rufus TaxID=2791028 RepID=UPI0018AF8872|nr:T9SS type A sorting domain-containing protein [Pontibacter sp. 172403-2]MBF9252716.1 T9SS type A sorting domain-containing protein [Pontibacter sp. 172403-2]